MVCNLSRWPGRCNCRRNIRLGTGLGRRLQRKALRDGLRDSATYPAGCGGARSVQGTAHRATAGVEDMGVNHGGFNAAVSEQLLHRANVIAVLKQVSGKRVPMGKTLARERVDACRHDAGSPPPMPI